MNTIKNQFPVIAVRNLVMYPGISVPIRIGRPQSTKALLAADAESGYVFVVLQKSGRDADEFSPDDLHRIGTVCKIEKKQGSESASFQVLLRGVYRFRVSTYLESEGAIRAEGEEWKDEIDGDEKTLNALRENIRGLAREILNVLPTDTRQIETLIESIEDLSFLAHLCAAHIDISVDKKQTLLEIPEIKNRVLKLLEFMQGYRDELKIQMEIDQKLHQKLGKSQREAILREQLKTIREELGEGGQKQDDSLFEKIEKAQMPENVKKIALEELRRLETVGNMSPESHVIRSYLDLLVALPWKVAAEGKVDLDAARKILDEEHFGLEKIKKRIIQHLAVMKLKKSIKGSILLFVGPPGVGKTSLGQSIAKALGRKFVRGSLGGVRDDAEIRGHRRTYIGAMPGRIIQGIKRAGENNPVFMLDEIDKLSVSFSGDPASALLEVLDPEQNNNFLDHYLDVPFDLSQVFFIATANTTESIPGPLLDRMEVIELSGYTTPEKSHIARKHLIQKELAAHGVEEQKLEIGEETLLRVITHYTREAGVRDLERKIAALIRGSTEKILSQPNKVVISPQDLEELLGVERFEHEMAGRAALPGVVTGLAWTPQGGDILFIESSLMPGCGKLILTGQLGDVMKESAQIALSLVRSQLPLMAAAIDFEKKDIHLHVPAGAVPKDGPSAGVAMFTTIASLFTRKAVNPKLAMTGEITLRGNVLPVGGIKEKVIAAHRAGIERVILPKRNERDLKEVPQEVISQLKFDFVDNVSELLSAAFGSGFQSREFEEKSLYIG